LFHLIVKNRGGIFLQRKKPPIKNLLLEEKNGAILIQKPQSTIAVPWFNEQPKNALIHSELKKVESVFCLYMKSDILPNKLD